MDLYLVLKVARTAPHAEIKQAFRKLALTLHPDVHGKDPYKVEEFRRVLDAFRVLGDPKQRAIYDSTLRTPHFGARSNGAVRVSRSSAATRDPLPHEYNVQEWNAWHYGVNAVSIDAVRQTRASTDDADAMSGYQTRFHRKQYERYNTEAESRTSGIDHGERHPPRSDRRAVSRLNIRRETRRRGDAEGTGGQSGNRRPSVTLENVPTNGCSVS